MQQKRIETALFIHRKVDATHFLHTSFGNPVVFCLNIQQQWGARFTSPVRVAGTERSVLGSSVYLLCGPLSAVSHCPGGAAQQPGGFGRFGSRT